MRLAAVKVQQYLLFDLDARYVDVAVDHVLMADSKNDSDSKLAIGKIAKIGGR